MCLLRVLECMGSVAHASLECAADTRASMGVGGHTLSTSANGWKFGKEFSGAESLVLFLFFLFWFGLFLFCFPWKCSCVYPL